MSSTIKYSILPATKEDLRGIYFVRHHSEHPSDPWTPNRYPPHLWPLQYRPSPDLPPPVPTPEEVVQDRIDRVVAVEEEGFEEEAKKGVVWVKACLDVNDKDGDGNGKIVGFCRLEQVDLGTRNDGETKKIEKTEAELKLHEIRAPDSFNEIKEQSDAVMGKVLPKSGHVCFMKMLFVHKDYQGLGIGRSLLQEAFRRTKEAGCLALYWESANTAEKFYLKNGAEKVGEVVTEAFEHGWEGGKKVEVKLHCMIKWV